jgi:hypothetical protein
MGHCSDEFGTLRIAHIGIPNFKPTCPYRLAEGSGVWQGQTPNFMRSTQGNGRCKEAEDNDDEPWTSPVNLPEGFTPHHTGDDE